jgi:hypothetical protein
VDHCDLHGRLNLISDASVFTDTNENQEGKCASLLSESETGLYLLEGSFVTVVRA